MVIVMNIYISKTNADRLASESNKSGLINSLLEAHYSGVVSHTEAVQQEVDNLEPKGYIEVENEETGELMTVKLCAHGKPPGQCKYMH